jgi:glycosyltransferase involved in cell wall biosynthesis
MKISVCIATYNGQKFILEQLNSILEQLPTDGEVIVSDDASHDDTIKLINSLNDNRIVLYQCQFRNLIKNFENAIKQSTGDVIFLSDQDDKWLPGKIETMINALKDNDLVVSDCYIGNSDLHIIRDSYFEWRKSAPGIMKNLWRNSYLGCCMCFKRRVLKKILPFPERIPMHDMWIGIVAEIYYKTKFIHKKLMVYRRHGQNATFLNADFSSSESLIKRLIFRISLVNALLKRMLGI